MNLYLNDLDRSDENLSLIYLDTVLLFKKSLAYFLQNIYPTIFGNLSLDTIDIDCLSEPEDFEELYQNLVSSKRMKVFDFFGCLSFQIKVNYPKNFHPQAKDSDYFYLILSVFSDTDDIEHYYENAQKHKDVIFSSLEESLTENNCENFVPICYFAINITENEDFESFFQSAAPNIIEYDPLENEFKKSTLKNDYGFPLVTVAFANVAPLLSLNDPTILYYLYYFMNGDMESLKNLSNYYDFNVDAEIIEIISVIDIMEKIRDNKEFINDEDFMLKINKEILLNQTNYETIYGLMSRQTKKEYFKNLKSDWYSNDRIDIMYSLFGEQFKV